jgi:hypothetical protein
MENRIFSVIILTISCGIAYFLWLKISHFMQIYKVAQDGIDTNGRVISQRKHRIKMPMSSGYYLDYTYIDRTGIAHECKSMVPYDLWKNHPDGSPIAVTYSKSMPEASLPRVLVEQARAIVAKKGP